MPRALRIPFPLRWLGLLGLTFAAHAGAADLRICTDQVDWKPFIRIVDGQAQGRHIDLLRRASSRAGIAIDVIPMPWVRCQLEAREGTVDGLMSLVFSPTRNLAYHYPEDARIDGLSRWSIEDIADVVVTLDDLDYTYSGDLGSLPQPVRVPRGWEIGPFLRAHRVAYDDGAQSDEANLAKLLRDGKGSVIANADTVRLAQAGSPNLQRLRISALPVRLQSYFIAFSRAAHVPDATRAAVWDAIARERIGTDPHGGSGP